MTELEKFYNERIKEPGYPEFSELTTDDKAILERTVLFACYKLNKAYEKLNVAFCEAIRPAVDLSHGMWVYQRITTTTRFERFCLFFIRKRYEYNEIENTTTTYKRFRGKLFVVGFSVNPPKHFNCRCTVEPITD